MSDKTNHPIHLVKLYLIKKKEYFNSDYVKNILYSFMANLNLVLPKSYKLEFYSPVVL